MAPSTEGFNVKTESDGQFRKAQSQFRNFISADPASPFPAEPNRYVLYLAWTCPWAHRANIVRSLKGLEDIIQLSVTDYLMTPQGIAFTGRDGTDEKDPIYGFTRLKDLYLKADPDYQGRCSVPVLWDKKQETIVSNESSEIIRMFYEAFDAFLPAEKQEQNKPNGGLLPPSLTKDIDDMNQWVYDTINNGVYKCGFASTQEAYEQNLGPLFASLDRLEAHLSEPGHQPYLFGENITEADIRLYTTLIRFDVAYHSSFKCNLKMIRHDYPFLYQWLRRLYWDETPETNGGAFKRTTYIPLYRKGYAQAGGMKVVPAGPKPDIHGLDEIVH